MIVAVTERATAAKRHELVQLGCEVVAFPGRGRVPIALLLTELGRRGMSNVLVEGGGQVLGAFADEGHIDQIEVYIAPILEGGDHARTVLRGKGLDSMRDAAPICADVEISQVGGDVRLAAGCLNPGALAPASTRTSDLDHGDAGSLKSSVVIAWIVLSVVLQGPRSSEHPFSATETRW